MGHWMGHNSDLLYMDLNYRILRGLQANVWGAYLRKGSSDYSGQYIQPEPPFLFGLRTNYTYYGLGINYQLMHELEFQAKLKVTDTSTQQNDLSFISNKISEFSILFSYGW
jgi:hypothetical protein